MAMWLQFFQEQQLAAVREQQRQEDIAREATSLQQKGDEDDRPPAGNIVTTEERYAADAAPPFPEAGQTTAVGVFPPTNDENLGQEPPPPPPPEEAQPPPEVAAELPSAGNDYAMQLQQMIGLYQQSIQFQGMPGQIPTQGGDQSPAMIQNQNQLLHQQLMQSLLPQQMQQQNLPQQAADSPMPFFPQQGVTFQPGLQMEHAQQVDNTFIQAIPQQQQQQQQFQEQQQPQQQQEQQDQQGQHDYQPPQQQQHLLQQQQHQQQEMQQHQQQQEHDNEPIQQHRQQQEEHVPPHRQRNGQQQEQVSSEDWQQPPPPQPPSQPFHQMQPQEEETLEALEARFAQEPPAEEKPPPPDPEADKIAGEKAKVASIEIGDSDDEVKAPPLADVYAVGDRVGYFSVSASKWINATVKRKNPDGTYDLNVKKRAPVSQISRTEGVEPPPVVPAVPAVPAVPLHERPELQPAPQPVVRPGRDPQHQTQRLARDMSRERSMSISEPRDGGGKGGKQASNITPGAALSPQRAPEKSFEEEAQSRLMKMMVGVADRRARTSRSRDRRKDGSRARSGGRDKDKEKDKDKRSRSRDRDRKRKRSESRGRSASKKRRGDDKEKARDGSREKRDRDRDREREKERDRDRDRRRRSGSRRRRSPSRRRRSPSRKRRSTSRRRRSQSRRRRRSPSRQKRKEGGIKINLTRPPDPASQNEGFRRSRFSDVPPPGHPAAAASNVGGSCTTASGAAVLKQFQDQQKAALAAGQGGSLTLTQLLAQGAGISGQKGKDGLAEASSSGVANDIADVIAQAQQQHLKALEGQRDMLLQQQRDMRQPLQQPSVPTPESMQRFAHGMQSQQNHSGQSSSLAQRASDQMSQMQQLRGSGCIGLVGGNGQQQNVFGHTRGGLMGKGQQSSAGGGGGGASGKGVDGASPRPIGIPQAPPGARFGPGWRGGEADDDCHAKGPLGGRFGPGWRGGDADDDCHAKVSPGARFGPGWRGGEADDDNRSDARDYRDARDRRDLRDPRDSRDHRDMRDGRDGRDVRDGRDGRDIRDMRDPRDMRDVRDARDARDSRDSFHEARDSRRLPPPPPAPTSGGKPSAFAGKAGKCFGKGDQKGEESEERAKGGFGFNSSLWSGNGGATAIGGKDPAASGSMVRPAFGPAFHRPVMPPRPVGAAPPSGIGKGGRQPLPEEEEEDDFWDDEEAEPAFPSGPGGKGKTLVYANPKAMPVGKPPPPAPPPGTRPAIRPPQFAPRAPLAGSRPPAIFNRNAVEEEDSDTPPLPHKEPHKENFGPRPPKGPPPGDVKNIVRPMTPTSKARPANHPHSGNSRPPWAASEDAEEQEQEQEQDKDAAGYEEDDDWEEDGDDPAVVDGEDEIEGEQDWPEDDWTASKEVAGKWSKADWDEWNRKKSEKWNSWENQKDWSEGGNESWDRQEDDESWNRNAKGNGKGFRVGQGKESWSKDGAKGKDGKGKDGKGKGKGKKKRKRGFNGVSEEAPAKLNGECWEEPKETIGLQLVRDMAANDVWWEYPLEDHSRRCYAGFLSSPFTKKQCSSMFDTIQNSTDWLQPEGPLGPIPRKTAWLVKRGCQCTYRYGQIEVPPAEFPPWMTEIMGEIMPYCGLSKKCDWPDSCNVNLYTDGGMSVGWHSDDEKLFQGKFRDILIVSLSLGVKRKFELRLNWPEEGEKPLRRLLLGSGDLLTMEGMTQKHMQHRVPREEQVQGPRINLTWRWVVKHTPQCPQCRNR